MNKPNVKPETAGLFKTYAAIGLGVGTLLGCAALVSRLASGGQLPELGSSSSPTPMPSGVSDLSQLSDWLPGMYDQNSAVQGNIDGLVFEHVDDGFVHHYGNLEFASIFPSKNGAAERMAGGMCGQLRLGSVTVRAVLENGSGLRQALLAHGKVAVDGRWIGSGTLGNEKVGGLFYQEKSTGALLCCGLETYIARVDVYPSSTYEQTLQDAEALALGISTNPDLNRRSFIMALSSALHGNARAAADTLGNFLSQEATPAS